MVKRILIMVEIATLIKRFKGTHQKELIKRNTHIIKGILILSKGTNRNTHQKELINRNTHIIKRN